MEDFREWPNQTFAIAEVKAKVASGVRRMCLTSPTGSGKSYILIQLAEWAEKNLGPVAIYTPRKLLTEQLARNFMEHEIPYGIRAAEFQDQLRLEEPVQICSPATENARCFKKVRWELHKAAFVLVDEIHLLKNSNVIEKILNYHYDNGAYIVIVTATPIGVSKMADCLIVAAKNSEMRACGALLPAYVYGCEEFDTSKIKRLKTGQELTKGEMKDIWTPAIFGFVRKHYERLNPERKPALLFAPGVQHSLWFAQEFTRNGIPWAHIDGEDVWYGGQFYKSNREVRDKVLAMSKSGEIAGISNRFVAREAVDLPWIYHLILATPIGSTVSFVQTVGRVLRAHPSMDHVIITDHGGNWHRHGSPNQDRDWLEYWGMPEHYAVEVRAERIRNKKEPEPFTCPRCLMVRTHGSKCPKCGYEHHTKARYVIQHDGTLKEHTGDIFKPRRERFHPDTQQKWTACYYRMMNTKTPKTFRQVEGLFFYENFYYPPRTLDFMPEHEWQWFSHVKDVPTRDLRMPAPAEPQEPQPDFDLSQVF